MKIISVLFVLLSGFEAWAQQAEPTPAPTLAGDWVMTQHICSSGARPWDQFLIGRDRLEAHFTADRFTTITDIGRCSAWTTGRYEIKGKTLVLHIDRSSSNCGPGDRLGSFTYMMQMHDADAFSLYMGPFRGGTCPAGDLLENTFERVH
jgi:hypothetical protein